MALNLAFFKTAGLTTFANIAHALAQWLLLMIVVKQFGDLTLSELVLCLSVASPLFLLFSFKIRSLIVIDYHNHRPMAEYLLARWFTQLLVILLIIAIAGLTLTHISSIILASVLLFKVSDGTCELCYSYWHKQQQFRQAAKSQVIRAASTTALLIITGLWSKSVELTFIAWSFTHLCFAIFDVCFVTKQIKAGKQRSAGIQTTITTPAHWRSIFRLYKEYWLVGVSITFGAMFVYLPNFAIEYFLDTELVGRFAAISYFLVAGGILINSLSQAATPKLSRLYNEQHFQSFLKLTCLLMAAGATIGLFGLVVASLIGEWILRLMYNEAIAQLQTELLLILVASLIRYSYIFLGSALNALQCLNQQVVVYGAGTLTLALALIWLTPLYQTQGVALAMIIACAVEFTVMLALFVKTWRSTIARSTVPNV